MSENSNNLKGQLSKFSGIISKGFKKPKQKRIKAVSGKTAISGSMTISNGNVTIENVQAQ